MKKILTVALALLATNAHAQSIPPACDQYMGATEICMKSAVNFLDRTDPEQAAKVREALENMKKIRTEIHKQVLLHGEEAVAEVCVSPQFVNQMMNGIIGIVMPLGFSGALDDNCKEAVSEIRAPQQ